jgi:NAD(P)-dependent dehydrogenase (short-subunit alcohol dehydrogenase family)
MDFAGKVAVVTGAGQGLGRGLAERLTAEGARVLVADVNPEAAESVASSLATSFTAADLSDPSAIQAVVDTARRDLGPVDIWISNAAYSRADDVLSVPDEAWDLGWRLNVMSHVWAARALLPEWLERGEGCLVQTVSAIALTLNHHDAVYATTKRAALALGEFLATNYGPKGIAVSCFCPRGMTSPRLLASLEEGSAAARNAMRTAVTPEEAARLAVEGIRKGQFLILTEEEELASHRAKANDYDGWITARRHQAAEERAASL